MLWDFPNVPKAYALIEALYYFAHIIYFIFHTKFWVDKKLRASNFIRKQLDIYSYVFWTGKLHNTYLERVPELNNERVVNFC